MNLFWTSRDCITLPNNNTGWSGQFLTKFQKAWFSDSDSARIESSLYPIQDWFKPNKSWSNLVTGFSNTSAPKWCFILLSLVWCTGFSYRQLDKAPITNWRPKGLRASLLYLDYIYILHMSTFITSKQFINQIIPSPTNVYVFFCFWHLIFVCTLAQGKIN